MNGKIVIVEHLEIFSKAFPGIECPKCNTQTRMLSTSNEWCYHCPGCNIRFNENKEIYQP